MPAQWSALPDYAGRALLLSGEVDTKYIATAERMQSGFQNAEHLVVPNAGHQLLMEKPQEVARAMAAFLNQYK
jgi:pimeloyl-ACP methyl ester carboxylesterase